MATDVQTESAGDSAIGQIDLALLHGRKTISLHDIFPTSPACTNFLKDLVCNQNKSIAQKSYGFLKKWRCTDNRCTWKVWITQKRPSQAKDKYVSVPTRNTKFGHVPVNAWYVSKIDLNHTQLCKSVAKPTALQLSLMKGFQSSLVEGHSSARARVAASLKLIDNINMDTKPATLYRAIKLFQSRVQRSDDYKLLPSYLRAFHHKNPGSRVALQLDGQGRFFRAFLLVGPIAKMCHSWLPVLQADGTHMKGESYNGQCITLIGIDGDGKNVQVAIAFVPSETVENFTWFFANCMAGGLDLANIPVYADRGKQRGAQKSLAGRGYSISLKFCAFHIALNVKGHFRSVDADIDRVDPFVFRLQKADTIAEYEATLDSVTRNFSATRTRRRADGVVEKQSVAEYLRAIHPTCWTNLGNYQHNEVELQFLKHHWKSAKSYGKPFPLFGVRTTSATEGENNALLKSGIRDSDVLMAIVAFCERAALSVAAKKKKSTSWQRDGSNVTPKAKLLFDKEHARSSSCTVTATSDSINYVEDCARAQKLNRIDEQGDTSVPPKLARTHKVDLNSKSCVRCISREHLKIPCRHLMAAMAASKSNSHRQIDLMSLFDCGYTVAGFSEAFDAVNIDLPLASELKADVSIQPPPLYKQPGRSTTKAKAQDKRKRQKRVPNRGERCGSSYQPSHANASVNADDDSMPIITHEPVHDFLSQQVIASVPQKRSPYTCSGCGLTGGHNIASCPNKTKKAEAGSEITPGVYLVGDCPIQALQNSA